MVGADVYFHTRARSHTAAQGHRAAVPGREVARVAVSGARGPAAGLRGGGSAWRARGRGLGFVAGVVLRAPHPPSALPLHRVNKQYRSTRCRLQSDSFCFGGVG